MTTQSEARKVQLVPDKIYSTWWWIMELDPSHPRNFNPKVTHLTGYSKFQGHDEARDKDYLLMSKILMLATNGYLKRTRKIEIYKREGNLILKNQDRQYFELYPLDFGIPQQVLGALPSVTSFLHKLYDHIRTGKDIKALLPKREKTFSKDEIFDIDRHNFKSQGHLYSWAEQKIKDGHAYLQVQSFVVKYLQRKPFMTNEPIHEISKLTKTFNVR